MVKDTMLKEFIIYVVWFYVVNSKAIPLLVIFRGKNGKIVRAREYIRE